MSHEIRASDADRHQTVRALEQHTAAGRLTLDEFSERVEQTYAARTLGDLAAVTRDLPATAVAPAAPATTSFLGTDNERWLVAAFVVAVVTLVLLALLMALR